MTGYQSKKAAASAKTIDEVNWADYEPDGLVHTAQKPKNVTYKEVADTMNALRKGNFSQQAVAKEVGKLKLYTTPPQRTWVGLNEQDFSAINQSCLTKLEAAASAESILKEKNT